MNLDEHFSIEELKLINVNHLPLKKNVYTFSRGARLAQSYVDTDDLDENNEPKVMIQEIYDNTWSVDGRRLEGFTRKLVFYHQDGSVFFEIDTTPELDEVSIEEIMESVWKRQIRYLKVAAENLAKLAETLPEPLKTEYLDVANGSLSIMYHYREEISQYESHGHPYFEDAINNENDAYILNLLSKTVRPPDSEFPVGLTAKESILHQLTGVIPT